jgi:hypothetical protein
MEAASQSERKAHIPKLAPVIVAVAAAPPEVKVEIRILLKKHRVCGFVNEGP